MEIDFKKIKLKRKKKDKIKNKIKEGREGRRFIQKQ
jgi:hypothetical protein